MDLTRAGYLFAHHYGYRYPAEIRYRLSPHDFYASFARCTCECCCERTRFPAAFERDLVEKRARSTTRSEETTTSSKEDIMLAQNQGLFKFSQICKSALRRPKVQSISEIHDFQKGFLKWVYIREILVKLRSSKKADA